MLGTSEAFLTPKQLAERSGWTVKSIRKLLVERKIRHIKHGNRYLIPHTALDEFLNACMIEPEADAIGRKSREGEQDGW